MQVKRLQGVFSWLIVLSEVSHVFCCVLPSIFSVLTIMVGVGVFSSMPTWMDGVHDAMHVYEVPVIAFSGIVLALGWCAHLISKRLDCHSTGCAHGPCEPKKDKNVLVLRIATVLFVINVSIYCFVHASSNNVEHVGAAVQHAHSEHNHQH